LFRDDAATKRCAGRHNAVSRNIATADVFLQRTLYTVGNIEERLSDDLLLLGQRVSCNMGCLEANTRVGLANTDF